MKEELQKIIDSHFNQLTNQLDISGGFLHKLLEDGVITADHIDEINAEKTKRKQIKELLEILKRQSDECFRNFCKVVLKQQPQLYKECLREEESLKDSVEETAK